MKQKIFLLLGFFFFAMILPYTSQAQKKTKSKEPVPVVSAGPGTYLREELQKVVDDAEDALNENKLKYKEYQKLMSELDRICYLIDKAMIDNIMTPRERKSIYTRIIKGKDRLLKFKRANGF
ncbi:MAG: hypothetical protein IPH58_07640 [Sphingobacteriales bacterium]|jgi:hypothetical protein|nr:hypothetical protein [Sphingobacteriales bacterium]